MINHLRTLLVNLDGTSGTVDYSYPGEEYIPPTYRAPSLTASMNEVRSILYGADPDRAFRNVRTMQFLNMLHSSELVDYVTMHDSRVTYWPFDDQVFTLLNQNFTVSPRGGTTTNLVFSGSIYNIEHGTVIYSKWDITVLDSDTVRVVNTFPWGGTTDLEYVIVSGRSTPLPFPNEDNVYFSFDDGVGASWEVTLLKKPSPDLGELVTLLDTSSRAAVDKLFIPVVGDFETWWDIWSDHEQPLSHRLGAVVLALGERTHELTGG